MTGCGQWACAGTVPYTRPSVPCGRPAVLLYAWKGKMPFGACREHADAWACLTRVGLRKLTPGEAAAAEVHGA